jgi:hypothetical protein
MVLVVQSWWGFTGKSVGPGLDHCDEVRSESYYVANSQCGQLNIWESIGAQEIVVAGLFAYIFIYKYAVSLDDYADIRRNSKKITHMVIRIENGPFEDPLRIWIGRDSTTLEETCHFIGGYILHHKYA